MTNKRSRTCKKISTDYWRGCTGSEGKYLPRPANPHESVSSIFSSKTLRPEIQNMDKKKLIKSSTRTMLPVVKKKSSLSPTSGIPKDAAVHFGNFYSLEKNPRNNGAGGPDAVTTKSELPVRDSSRSEFTRQMVHKLERLAGTEYYARQISALLEETVEPPDYVVKQLPGENLFPDEGSDPQIYPLWYKDPDKTSYRSLTNESSTSSATSKDNVSTTEIRLGDRATSEFRLINTKSNVGDRRFVNNTECDYNSDSTITSSEITYNSRETTEDESTSEEMKIKMYVE